MSMMHNQAAITPVRLPLTRLLKTYGLLEDQSGRKHVLQDKRKWPELDPDRLFILAHLGACVLALIWLW